jgi:23S rRNA (uracil1939-C5)-methyltransferase
LRDHVVARAQAYAPAHVIDAYAGTGETAAPMAEGGATVTAIELDPDAADACRQRLPRRSRVVAGRVEEALPMALPADVVILNPPRTGVHERVTAALAAAAPPPRAVIYVSCNPATLARDLTRLSNYDVTSVVAFDMFPQTAHVETVCELVPAAA